LEQHRWAWVEETPNFGTRSSANILLGERDDDRGDNKLYGHNIDFTLGWVNAIISPFVYPDRLYWTIHNANLCIQLYRPITIIFSCFKPFYNVTYKVLWRFIDNFRFKN
jgi:hypothetical protein